MASREIFTKSLKSSYDRVLFGREVLSPVFGDRLEIYSDLYPAEHEPNQTEAQVIQQVGVYGQIVLDDTTEVKCYEILLQPNVRIEQNKVTIQSFVRKLLLDGEAALVNFVAPATKNIWRFTLVAKDSSINEEGDIISKTTHSKRYTYLVEKDQPNRTLAERLEALSLEDEVDLAKLIKAFSVEKMSDEFFEEYRYHYQNFVQYLTGKRMVREGKKWKEKKISKSSPYLVSIFNGNEKDARDFCKKLLGRIIFLYFLQKKRWLGATTTEYEDGSLNFVSDIFDETGGDERFFPIGLSDLFFNALNKERPNDDYTTPAGKKVKMPYLNGGLFTRDRVDELIHKKGDIMTFPAELFSHPLQHDVPFERGFLDFLNSYNFTVYEDSPDDHTVAVDPEMLGHIFENLLEDNKDKGAFYTPKEIVRYMCQESLAEYLTTHLSKEYKVYKRLQDDQIEIFGNDGRKGQLNLLQEMGDKALKRDDIDKIVKDKDIAGLTDVQLRQIDLLLDKVKICDPAIGSGAFPMGLLQEIYTIKEIIAYELKQPWNASKVKEQIIQHSIYGVDIEKGAVDIARLRFWLSLVVDTVKPKALPNLDYRIVVGNSLLSKFEDQIIEIDWDEDTTKHGIFGQQFAEKRKGLLSKISKKQAQYFDPEAGGKNQLKQEIRDLKIELLINQLEFLVKVKGTHKKPDGSGKVAKQLMEQYLQTLGWKQAIQELKKLQVQEDKDLGYFDWKLDFADVLNKNVAGKAGFDIVIANPPYLRVQEIARTMPEEKEYLEKKFSVAKKSYDLANLFFELAVDLANDQSSNCFIFPHKFFNSSSTEVFREYLWQGKYIDKIVHFGANMVFNDADTYTCIAHFSPRENEGFELRKFEFGEDWKSGLLSLNLSPVTYKNLGSASQLYGTNQWIFFKEDFLYKSFAKLYEDSLQFTDIFEDIFQGIATSNDKLYLISIEYEDAEYFHGKNGLDDVVHLVEKRYFKPILKGKDVQRYSNLQPSLYVFFPYDIENGKAKPVDLDFLKKSFPKTYTYVKAYEQEFKRRERGKAGKMKHWHTYIYPKNLTKFEQVKLSSMEICAKHPNVTLNDHNYYHNTKVYSWVKKKNVEESYEYFLAIANSSLIWWFLINTGDTLQGDARTFKTNYLNPFPLPKEVSEETDSLFKSKVQQILADKRDGLNTEEKEKEVDAMVLKLYGLTHEEALQINPKLALSENEYDNLRLENPKLKI